MARNQFEDLEVINGAGQIVRYDIELIDNGRGKQFAIATERPDSEAPLFTARSEMGGQLKETEGCRLEQCIYVEKNPFEPNAMSAMLLKEVAPNHFRPSDHVRNLVTEKELDGWVSRAVQEAAPDQQVTQLNQMRDTGLPTVDREAEKQHIENDL